MPSRTSYTGTERKLVFAFDVGTTYSGISYVILDPGQEPLIQTVTRFPARGKAGGDAKVPTVIYYDSNGIPQVIGAETEKEGLETIAEDSQWVKVEWFKLHLRPRTGITDHLEEEIPPLPQGKTAVDVFADFLRYLDHCTRTYIQETHIDGASLLTSGKVDFILSHPNAWEGAQQTLMRDAAVQAGLITSAPGDRDRVSFISEGEASLNFCTDKDLINDSIQQGHGVTIVDAGGGTLDVSTYAKKAGSSTEYEEITVSQSYFNGSIFVTRAAARHLQELLQGTRFQDDITFMTDKFDKTTKLAFRDPSDPQYIKFGSVRDRDSHLGIRAGSLKLDGPLVAGFFEPSIQAIITAVTEQKRLSPKQVSTVFLVGGFAANDYLFSEVRERLRPLEISVHRPDAHLNKAVSDGAIVNSLHRTVRTRVAKYSYGVRSTMKFDPLNPEHAKRSHKCVAFMNGTRGLTGHFGMLLQKGTRVSETGEFRKGFFQEAEDKSHLAKHNTTTISVYRGCSLPPPTFMDQEPAFKVKADLTRAIDGLKKIKGSQGKYFRLNYDIVVRFGATEFKAQYVWHENGIEHRGPAEILYGTDAVY